MLSRALLYFLTLNLLVPLQLCATSWVPGSFSKRLPSCRIARYDTQASDPRQSGQMIAMSDSDKRKVIVFWTLGCGPCISEISLLNGIASQLKQNNIEIYVILINGDGSRIADWGGATAYFAHGSPDPANPNSWQKTFPNLTPYYDQEGTAAHAFEVNATPVMVLADEKNYVLKRFEGFKPGETPSAFKQSILDIFNS